ncbi:MAG: energy transducer TonB [Burkholderiales bacterium]
MSASGTLIGLAADTTALRRLGWAALLSAGCHWIVFTHLVPLPAAAGGIATGAPSGITVTLEKKETAADVAPLPEPEKTTASTSKPREKRPAGGASAAADSSPLAPGSAYYYKPSELDRRPFPLSPIDLQTRIAEDDGDDGSVVLRLLISESGRIERAVIVTSSGNAMLETLAHEAFSATRFSPGFKNGRAVKSQMMVEVTLHAPAR